MDSGIRHVPPPMLGESHHGTLFRVASRNQIEGPKLVSIHADRLCPSLFATYRVPAPIFRISRVCPDPGSLCFLKWHFTHQVSAEGDLVYGSLKLQQLSSSNMIEPFLGQLICVLSCILLNPPLQRCVHLRLAALCADYRGKSLVDGCNALDKEGCMSPVALLVFFLGAPKEGQHGALPIRGTFL